MSGSVSRIARMLSSTDSLRKIGRLLRQIADSVPCPLVHRHSGDVGAVEKDPSGVWLDEADDHIEGRRLPRAVRAQKSDDLALLKLQGDVVHDCAPTVDLHQPFRLENAAARRWPTFLQTDRSTQPRSFDEIPPLFQPCWARRPSTRVPTTARGHRHRAGREAVERAHRHR